MGGSSNLYTIGNYAVEESEDLVRFRVRERDPAALRYWTVNAALGAFIMWLIVGDRPPIAVLVAMVFFALLPFVMQGYVERDRVPALSKFPRVRRTIEVHRQLRSVAAQGYRSAPMARDGFLEIDGRRYPLESISAIRIATRSIHHPRYGTTSFYRVSIRINALTIRGYELETYTGVDLALAHDLGNTLAAACFGSGAKPEEVDGYKRMIGPTVLPLVYILLGPMLLGVATYPRYHASGSVFAVAGATYMSVLLGITERIARLQARERTGN